MLRKLLGFLFLTLPAFAQVQGNYTGNCEQGNNTVSTATITSVTTVKQSFPQCTVKVNITGGANGLVSTNGTTVTWQDGTLFNGNTGNWAGLTITINSVPYVISSVASTVSLTLTSSAGTQTDVAYSIATAPAPIFVALLGTQKANPFTANADGSFSFYSGTPFFDTVLSNGTFPNTIPSPFTQGAQQAPNPLRDNLISDDDYYRAGLSLVNACNVAVAEGATVTVVHKWLAISSQTLGCNIIFTSSVGLIQAASGDTVVLSGAVTCPAGQQCFDASIGTIQFGGTLTTSTSNVAFGALCNGTHDDAPATQAAINSLAISAVSTYGGTVTVGANSGFCALGSSIIVPRGVSVIGLNPVASYFQALSGGTFSTVSSTLCGSTTCSYLFWLKGPSTNPLHYTNLSNLTVDANSVVQVGIYANAAQELTFVEHDVIENYLKAGIFYTTAIQNVSLNDLYLAASSSATGSYGIAITTAISRIDISRITIYANAQQTNQPCIYLKAVEGYHVSGIHCEDYDIGLWIASNSVGEIDDLTWNPTIVTGTYFDSTITSPHSVKNSLLNGATTNIADAAQPGANTCNGISNIVCKLDNYISEYNTLTWLGGNQFISCSATAILILSGATSNCSTYTAMATVAQITEITGGSIGFYSYSGLTPGMTFSLGTPVYFCNVNGCQVPSLNHILTETGVNNAIASAAYAQAAPLVAGLTVTIQLAHSLQAGANTFAYNGGSAVAIKSHRNVANNIGTAYAGTGTIELNYNGSAWLDLSQ